MGAAESTAPGHRVHADFDSLDFYEILDISENATADEVKYARRQMALQHHPDKNRDDPGATRRFTQVQEAYETLIDSAKRRDYDYTRRTSSIPRAAPAPTPPHESNPREMPGACMSTEGRTSSENWFEWLFGHGEQHAYSKSEFVYKTYSSRRSSASGPGISSKDIAQFVNSLGNFKWYSRDSQDAFSIFRDFFACLAHDEWLISGERCPSFGCEHSCWMRDGWSEEGLREMNVHGPEVREFYRFWTNFKTKKNFEWIQKYAYNPAELHAQNLRFVMKENKIVQQRFQQEYNQLIQKLARTLQELDPRYQLHVALQGHREWGKAQPHQNKNQKKKKRNKKRK